MKFVVFIIIFIAILFIVWALLGGLLETLDERQFIKRYRLGNKYISSKLKSKHINPFNHYELIEVIDLKQNSYGTYFVRYKIGDTDMKYSCTAREFANQFNIYEYGPTAEDKWKKEIHQKID